MAGPFLATTWPVRVHFEQAYFRLLAQLSPAAVVAAALAYSRANATIDAESRSPGGNAETGA